MDQARHHEDASALPGALRRRRVLPPANGAALPSRLTALSAAEVDQVLKTAEGTTEARRRDLALISLSLHCVVRPGAIPGLRAGDYVRDGGKRWLRFHAERWDAQLVALQPRAAFYLDAYLFAAGAADNDDVLLFRPINEPGEMVATLATRKDVMRAIRRRFREAGFIQGISAHLLRATGLSLMLNEGVSWEEAKALAGFHHDHHLARYAGALASAGLRAPRPGHGVDLSRNRLIES